MTGDLTAGRLFKEIDDSLQRHGDNELRERGITTSQLSLLLELCDTPDGKLPMKRIEARLRVAQPTVVGLVSRLEQKKLVERMPDTEDARAKIVEITEAGRREAEQSKAVLERTEEKMLSGLTDTERLILMALLKKVHASIS